MFVYQNSDVLACGNGTVWSIGNLNEPKNLAKVLQEQNVPINFAEGFNLCFGGNGYTLGGPTGLWSSREKEGFEKSKESSELYSWRGV